MHEIEVGNPKQARHLPAYGESKFDQSIPHLISHDYFATLTASSFPEQITATQALL
jgi:hypothetical protein